MSTRWQEFFEKAHHSSHSVLEAAADHWHYHWPLYGVLRAFVPPPATVLDVGCGPGFTSILLQGFGYSVTGIDNDPVLVESARRNAGLLGVEPVFEEGSAFELERFCGKFDVALSVGVLEHFDTPVTVDLLRKQAECARFVLTEFPSSHTPVITDERFYGMRGFADLHRRAGLRPIRTMGYGDVPGGFHRLVRLIVPHAALRFAQNRFTYAMSMVCLAARKT